MPALILIRVRIQDLYTLRNAIYKSLSVLEKGYSGTYVGISNDAERVPPCESQPLLNFGMGLFYFTNEADARRFIYSDQGFLESDFLECSDMMIIPMARPMHLNTNGTALLFTEMVRSENYCQMPPSGCTFNMEQCGAVPNIVDTIQISMVRAYEARPGGYRISQFPNKKIFYDWVKSDCGAMFRDEMCKVRSLNTYIATFTKDLF